MTIDGIKRQSKGWDAWAVTTRLEVAPYSDTIWRAVACHQTQISSIKSNNAVWESEGYYRVFSMVNGGRNTEVDLFEGLT